MKRFKAFINEGDVIKADFKSSKPTSKRAGEVYQAKINTGGREANIPDAHPDYVNKIGDALKRSTSEHHQIEGDFEDYVNANPKASIGEMKDAAGKLLSHMHNKYQLTLMQKGAPDHPQKFADTVLTLSKGIRHAHETLGTDFPGYPNHGIYMNQHFTGGFEDGYSGETGISIKRGASSHEIGEFLSKHIPKQMEKRKRGWSKSDFEGDED